MAHASAPSSSFLVHPARQPLRGEVAVPGDKSIGHRAVLFSALAQGRSRLRGLSDGQDNRRTVAALQALGVPMRPGAPGELEVEGQGLGGLRQAAGHLDCGNSGTSMRLLCGVLAAQPFASALDGDEYLRLRPMRRVAEPLAGMGGRITGRAGEEIGKKAGEIYPPLHIAPAGALRGIHYDNALASAQVKSAVLLCGLWAEGATEVAEPHRSRDHSERLLRHQGAPLSTGEGARGAWARLDPAGWARVLRPLDLAVPGDLSSAAFLLGAGLVVPGSRVRVRGVGVNPTRTGVLDAFAQLCPGAVQVVGEREAAGEPVAEIEARGGDGLHPMDLHGALSLRALDELPLLAALAGAAEGETEIRGAAELRVKESDRIQASCALLRGFGVECEERPDGLRVLGRGPGGLRAAEVDSFGDHRIAVAAAVLALAAPGPTRVRDTGNVATSFPGFAASLRALGAEIEEG